MMQGERIHAPGIPFPYRGEQNEGPGGKMFEIVEGQMHDLLTLVRAKNPVFGGLAKAHAVRAGVRAAQGFEYHT